MKRSFPAPLALSPAQRRAFALAERAARRAVRRRFRVARLAKNAYVKLGRHEGALARVARDLRSLIRLARAWAARDYQELPWQSIVFIVAAIVYFINPIDLIPDVLTGLGFIDDAAVIGAVVRSVHDDLVAFRHWERLRMAAPPTDPASVRALHGRASAAA